MRLTTTPKRRLYPVLGLFLAVGAPGGLLVMRALVHGELGNWGWAVEELLSRALTYGYIAGATALLLFVGLGAVLGSHEDLLRRVSLTDPLTGLPNRRHSDRRLLDELARVDRYKNPLTLMLIDLDGLKAVNDLSGHEVGGATAQA